VNSLAVVSHTRWRCGMMATASSRRLVAICRGPRHPPRLLHGLRLPHRHVEVRREDLRRHPLPEEV
jgi:hypothetical protein